QENAKTSCCLNGGLCIMGSFCHCTSGFYGRFCEKELLNRSCGTLPHGTWIKSGCNACQCYDGTMICSPNRYSGCETAQWKTGIEENPTFTEGEARDPELADDNYEYYYMYEEENNGARQVKHEITAVMKHCWITKNEYLQRLYKTSDSIVGYK
ncbi:hypothetical protein ACJMK2_040978, partial [Sinanodonta woodiana]